MEQIKDIDIKRLELNKGQVEGLPKNPRFIRDERYKALVKSIEDAPEMLKLRELLVVEHGSKFVVIGGNMRLRACKELGMETVPCKVLPADTPVAKLREYAIKDNNGFGEDDWDVLANEWDAEELQEWGMELPMDWDVDGQGDVTATEDDFDESEVTEAVCKRGEVWKLGEHRLMCGDSTSEEDFVKLMGEERADMVFTDPPYGMGKESDGVLNDNLNYDDLLEFNKQWIPLSFEYLKNNGSWYCWGVIEPLMDIYSNILKPMIKQKIITFRNMLTWKKGAFGSGGGTGVGQEIQRSYFPETENCLFVMCGVQGFNNNQDNYFDGWEPIRSYLAAEAERVGLDNKQLKEICGVGMFSHWFTKSQWAFITEEHYKELQAHYRGDAFKREYDAFKREYDELKREYYATRAYFDNTHDMMTDVWDFQRVRGDERAECGGHATPKPVALCGRAIKTSSMAGECVLDLFGGSGSTLIACEQLGRKCRMMELDPHYCDVIIARWEKLTGQKAERISDGQHG